MELGQHYPAIDLRNYFLTEPGMIISIALPNDIPASSFPGWDEFISKLRDSCTGIDLSIDIVQNAPDRLFREGSSGKVAIICSGASCPDVFEQAANGLKNCIIIAENPEFRGSIKEKLSRIECPVLLLSSANMLWEQRKGAISYHDLISGSLLINVRTKQEHPLFMLNTQAFNGAVRFIHENLG